MTLYRDLGVPADADASTIRKAYRKRAQKSHPDKGGDPGAFHAIQRAYDVLCDPQRREKYDRTGNVGEEPGLREQAMQNIAAILQQTIDNVDVEHTDVLSELHRHVRTGLDKAKAEIAKCKEGIAKREKTIARFKRKGNGENLMSQFLEHDIRGRRTQIEGFERVLTVGEEMQRILAEYEYAADKRQSARYTTFSYTNA